MCILRLKPSCQFLVEVHSLLHLSNSQIGEWGYVTFHWGLYTLSRLKLLCQFLSGYVIGFVKGWKLTLTMLASLPVMVLTFSIMGLAMKKTLVSTQLSYAKGTWTTSTAVYMCRTFFRMKLWRTMRNCTPWIYLFIDIYAVASTRQTCAIDCRALWGRDWAPSGLNPAGAPNRYRYTHAHTSRNL